MGKKRFHYDTDGIEPISRVIENLDTFNILRPAVRDFACDYVQQHGKYHASLRRLELGEMETEHRIWTNARMIVRVLEIHQGPINAQPYIECGQRYCVWLEQSTEIHGRGDDLDKRCDANMDRPVVQDGYLQHTYKCSDEEFVDPIVELLRNSLPTVLDYVDPELRESLDKECFGQNRRSEVIKELESIFAGIVATGSVPTVSHTKALDWGRSHLNSLGV